MLLRANLCALIPIMFAAHTTSLYQECTREFRMQYQIIKIRPKRASFISIIKFGFTKHFCKIRTAFMPLFDFRY
ncbi:hypothetical protein A8A01_22030 [Ewingella americana]|nr:hypothetical protein A8A01_22030 [Ewingella americana]